MRSVQNLCTRQSLWLEKRCGKTALFNKTILTGIPLKSHYQFGGTSSIKRNYTTTIKNFHFTVTYESPQYSTEQQEKIISLIQDIGKSCEEMSANIESILNDKKMESELLLLIKILNLNRTIITLKTSALKTELLEPFQVASSKYNHFDLTLRSVFTWIMAYNITVDYWHHYAIDLGVAGLGVWAYMNYKERKNKVEPLEFHRNECTKESEQIITEIDKMNQILSIFNISEESLTSHEKKVEEWRKSVTSAAESVKVLSESFNKLLQKMASISNNSTADQSSQT